MIVTIDGDLQDDPAEIPHLLAKLDEGFDLVSGWKATGSDPLGHVGSSREIYNRAVGARDRRPPPRHELRAQGVSRRGGAGLPLYGELHRFLPVLANQRGYRIAELPVNHRPRANGRSRYGVERYLRGFFDLLTVSFIGRYRHRPLHLFGGLGLRCSAGASRSSSTSRSSRPEAQAIGNRPLLILGVLLVVVGIQLLSLGLIGEMLTSLHEEKARGERRYVRDTLR